MSKVFVDVGISLDGFVAGPNRGPRNPLGDGGIEIHQWMFLQKKFRQILELGDDGETGDDNRNVAATFERAGAHVMGKRMFEEGEANWPENAPFRTPVFVLTHERRSPWERKGGTTFHFVNDGIYRALELARSAAGSKDVRISGGADVIRQYLNAGLVDELQIHYAPVLLGEGVPLFHGMDKRRFSIEIVDAKHSPHVTHVRYAVRYK
ncbi:MAG TPA: dihydrofolate reductase family protein [Myxococcaceae bacterium]|nr:dihydrofolate reductase family protein [Myxococcaceae bacterium]